ncbi:MAG: hypothetical protein IJ645_10755 [Ruminococcus sp.]|nr:hypothetical protein [Ruminococcus sp.]
MKNTVKTNTKANVKKNSKNSLKSNKTFIAAVSAAVTAVTMTAGLALTVAIVSPAEKTTPQAAVTTTVTQAPKAVVPAEAAVKPLKIDNTAKAVSNNNAKAKAILNETKTAEPEQKTAPVVQQETAPAVQQQAAPVVQQQATPAVQQKATPAVQQKATPAVQQQAAPVVEQKAAPAVEQNTETPKSGTPVIPQGEVNDWKTHDAKDGFPIGTFFNGNSTLNVVKLDNANYSITVTEITGLNTANVYDIKAVANGSKMIYKNAVKNAVVFDADGHVAESQFIDNAHNGTFDASDAGYTWVDTEGTTIFVPWFGY